jgi:hypothetical protein
MEERQPQKPAEKAWDTRATAAALSLATAMFGNLATDDFGHKGLVVVSLAGGALIVTGRLNRMARRRRLHRYVAVAASALACVAIFVAIFGPRSVAGYAAVSGLIFVITVLRLRVNPRTVSAYIIEAVVVLTGLGFATHAWILFIQGVVFAGAMVVLVGALLVVSGGGGILHTELSKPRWVASIVVGTFLLLFGLLVLFFRKHAFNFTPRQLAAGIVLLTLDSIPDFIHALRNRRFPR